MEVGVTFGGKAEEARASVTVATIFESEGEMVRGFSLKVVGNGLGGGASATEGEPHGGVFKARGKKVHGKGGCCGGNKASGDESCDRADSFTMN